MVNEAKPAHFAADRLEPPRRYLIFVTEGRKSSEKLLGRILELDKDSQESLLVTPVPREEQPGKLIHSLDSVYLVAVEFDLGAWHISHPYLFGRNRRFPGRPGRLDEVKIFPSCRETLPGKSSPTENPAIPWLSCATRCLEG